jgi:hypothetical protein
VRNALILLVVVALVILGFGALNNGTTVDLKYVVDSLLGVSLLWVAMVVAAIVVVAGLLAALLARSAVVATRRKLEKELQATYERLREAESLLARQAASEGRTAVDTTRAVDTTQAVDTAVVPGTVPADEESTVVKGDATVSDGDRAVRDGETHAIGADPDPAGAFVAGKAEPANHTGSEAGESKVAGGPRAADESSVDEPLLDEPPIDDSAERRPIDEPSLDEPRDGAGS